MSQQTVRQWLAQLKLEQYAARFESEAIDFELLPDLGDAELEQLGVTTLGHRLKLKRAIAELAAGGAAVPPAASSAPAVTAGQPAAPPAALPGALAMAPPLPPPPPHIGAERRQLTVMFCDLVGSTAMSQRMDPEDLRTLMQSYQRICGAAVGRADGHVAQYLGDGLMVYFGWPRAHEDDARRAVQVALEIVAEVSSLKAAEPLQVRIGIATGPVVVGTGSESDLTLPRTAVGETPNLAARTQSMAEPGQVLVAPGTRRLLGDAFDCEDLGEFELKGIVQPMRLWRVLGESVNAGRFAAASGTRLTAMVNRELELALLADRWARARDGQGQAVLLVGEPGIGKSRLLAEVCERAGEEFVLLRAQCSELHQHSAFYPVINNLQRSAGFERGDSAEQRLDKLEALLRRNEVFSDDAAAHYAALLSLPVTRYPALRTSAQKQKRNLVDLLVQFVMHAATRQPVLLVFEDLHWMDPSTLELIDHLVASIRRAPVMLLLTSRHNQATRWGALSHVSTQGLVGLNRSHSLQLASRVAAMYGLPPGTLERIVERTDGVPLFLEEVTRQLLESPGLHAGTRAEDVEIPATLKDSLTARLDQLGNAKRAAQLGSVLGRQFRHELLLALSGMSDEALQGQLDRLAAAGLISHAGSGASLTYTFHHALIQDAAYESLLKSDRRQLHARAGELLAAQFPEVAEQEPELLARHHAAGENYELAVPMWLKAGQRAWQRSAAEEAIAHLSAGLAVVDRMADPAVRESTELKLQSALGVVYFAAVSYAAPQAQQAFLRALALCERISDVALKVPVLYGVGAFQTMKGNMRDGHAAFERLRSEAAQAGTPRLRMYAQSMLAWSHYNRADYDACVAAADQTLRLYEDGALAGGPRLSVADPKIISECHRAAALWALGHADQARAVSDAVLAHARALGEPYSLAYTLTFASLMVPARCGDYALVVERAEEGIRLAAELGYPFMEVSGVVERAWASAQLPGADVAAAIEEMDEALARLTTLGVRYHHARLLAHKARLLLRLGQEGAAQLAVAQALAEIESSGQLAVEQEVQLAEAAVLVAHGGEQRPLAEATLRMAHDTARERGARAWQLRAAIALARLAAADGDREAAREWLQALLPALTEGRDTADHREASALLESLA
jgi:predicted ATPase/class 3 adenylate cyclase